MNKYKRANTISIRCIYSSKLNVARVPPRRYFYCRDYRECTQGALWLSMTYSSIISRGNRSYAWTRLNVKWKSFIVTLVELLCGFRVKKDQKQKTTWIYSWGNKRRFKYRCVTRHRWLFANLPYIHSLICLSGDSTQSLCLSNVFRI